MRHFTPEIEQPTFASMTAFHLAAHSLLTRELKDDRKPVGYIAGKLREFYGNAIYNPRFGLMIYREYGTPDEFVKEILESSEKIDWIRKTKDGKNYELNPHRNLSRDRIRSNKPYKKRK